MKRLGFTLFALGLFVLVYSGISFSRQETVFDLAAIRATAAEQHDLPVSPIAGGISMLGGLMLLVVPRKRTAWQSGPAATLSAPANNVGAHP